MRKYLSNYVPPPPHTQAPTNSPTGPVNPTTNGPEPPTDGPTLPATNPPPPGGSCLAPPPPLGPESCDARLVCRQLRCVILSSITLQVQLDDTHVHKHLYLDYTVWVKSWSTIQLWWERWQFWHFHQPQEWSISNFPCSQKYYTREWRINLAFHSLFRWKVRYTTNSHNFNYTFIFKRSGECTFRTWKWKGYGQTSEQQCEQDCGCKPFKSLVIRVHSDCRRLRHGVLQNLPHHRTIVAYSRRYWGPMR